MKRFQLGLALPLVATSVACGSNAASTRTNAQVHAAKVQSLSVVERPVPRLQLPHYRTTGSYFRLVGGGLELWRVNRAIDKALLSHEARYAQLARPIVASMAASELKGANGRFDVYVRPTLLSASTALVSALVPILELLPGGNDGQTWLAVNQIVPSGRPIRLRDVLDQTGLNALSFATRRALTRQNSCFRAGLANPTQRQYSAQGLSPQFENYRFFALIPSGLALGFPIGDVAGVPCGRIVANISYADLKPYLTSFGREIIRNVRPPRNL